MNSTNMRNLLEQALDKAVEKQTKCNCKLVNGQSCEHGYRLNTPNVRLITEALRKK